MRFAVNNRKSPRCNLDAFLTRTWYGRPERGLWGGVSSHHEIVSRLISYKIDTPYIEPSSRYYTADAFFCSFEIFEPFTFTTMITKKKVITNLQVTNLHFILSPSSPPLEKKASGRFWCDTTIYTLTRWRPKRHDVCIYVLLLSQ